MTPLETRNEKLAEKVVKNLKARHFDAFYCATKEEAKAKILSLIPENDTVGYGGSVTIDALGVKEALREKGTVIFDRDLAKDREEALGLMRKALTSDTFLLGCNAMTEDGEMVNIDGTGNRVAALIFGPKSVIVAVSMNKITKTLGDAMSRARNLASPVNAQRFGLSTPCSATGSCADCKSADSICRQIVITRLSSAGRIKVVLIGEELGF